MITEDGQHSGQVGDEAEVGLVQAPSTGDPGLDEALRELALASAVPLEDQLPVIEAVHRTLQDRLADVED
ncbi:MAG: hypothetical protein WAL50_03900 [Kineosporiaceae bacterium]